MFFACSMMYVWLFPNFLRFSQNQVPLSLNFHCKKPLSVKRQILDKIIKFLLQMIKIKVVLPIFELYFVSL